ncbi:hypothetical protein FGO68_gene108 [Halteria grandinella]|uniref:Uncharacterized protein n=1 Tax=Halteria grandinella TaxID=5974 RepID=A0A8J8NH08_HALGN|nr:hypothetical protein FGO68_gene108 [Halteria grandinella]
MTGVNVGEGEPTREQILAQLSQQRPQTDESERGNQDNQIFHVQDAEPPIDFDSPYSRLPSNVVLARVKKNVEKSMTFKNKSHAVEWKRMFETEHANAIISDGFWYVICKVFKKGKKQAAAASASATALASQQVALAISATAVIPGSQDAYGQAVSYDAYQEFILDRIAANYVSFTILDDEDIDAFQTSSSSALDSGSNSSHKKTQDAHKRREHVDFQQKQGVRRKFFEQFYDIIAQSVFYSLFFAYPKSRGQTLNNDMKRKLLNIFSKLFTGMKIQSASYEHWFPVMGQGSMLQNSLGAPKKAQQREDLSLIDLNDKKGGVSSQAPKKQTNRERIHMKYSPLVERYLMSHKYETMNNVREWKMLLTQRREGAQAGAQQQQSTSDQKFERYKKIAEAAVDEMKRMSKDYDKYCQVLSEKVRENEKAAAKFIQMTQQQRKEKLENGSYSEYANLIVSIFNSEHAKDMNEGSH